MEYEKNGIHAEGKTKRIWETGDTDIVRVESKNDITAFDDAQFTSIMPDKAVLANITTCRVFELLEEAGLPVAYLNQISNTEFRAINTRMIPLEIVARRLAGPKSSYVSRYPHLGEDRSDKKPYRFHQLKTEVFLKTTKGKVIVAGKMIWGGLDPAKGEEDPLVADPYQEIWKFVHSKKPFGTPEYDLKKAIPRNIIISDAHLKKVMKLIKQCFLVLEGAFKALGFRIPDIKVEFGINSSGELLISDVLDNDSWRLSDFAWEEYSKQYYRDLIKTNPGGLTEDQLREVARRYRVVAELAKSFRIPNQALVFWRGSKDDPFLELEIEDKYRNLPGVHIENIAESGHKSPRKCADRINELETKYPDGGVIVLNVGRSNGAGPPLASRTTWPVISIPKDYEKFPEDVHSSVHLPSKVPNLTIWPESNAIRAALNILALKNPAVYAARQMEIEELDY